MREMTWNLFLKALDIAIPSMDENTVIASSNRFEMSL
jgi:hypothetical protein